MSKFCWEQDDDPLYGHFACREKCCKENSDANFLFACVGDSLLPIKAEEKESEKTENEREKSSRGKMWSLENFYDTRNLEIFTVSWWRTENAEQKYFFIAVEKRSLSRKKEKHTSEHGALIRAAGSKKNRYDFFLIFHCFDFYERKTKKVFKKDPANFAWWNFKWWKLYLNESWENLFCEKLIWLWDESTLLVCELRNIYRSSGMSTREKHFLIGGRSFIRNIIHLPVLWLKQPIAEQQERKNVFLTWASPTFFFRP